MANYLYRGDLPAGLDLGPVVAIDTETMGLNPARDRLCLVQLSAGDGDAHLVQILPGAGAGAEPRSGCSPIPARSSSSTSAASTSRCCSTASAC